MNKHYIHDEQTDIDSDFDSSSRFMRGVATAIALTFLLIVLAYCAMWPKQAHAQAPTPQDFKVCSDTACVQIIVTPVAPPCPAKPADETRAGACPAGTVGGWTQTRTYASAAAPACWTASAWTPVNPPAGACTTPTPGAPTNLTVTFAPNATNPANSNVTLTWGAVTGTTTYEVWRCTGASCTNFAFLEDVTVTTYTALNQPPNSTTKYRVRAWKPTTGPYSSTLTVVTPAAPPPPTVAGKATIGWTPPTKNTDGSTLSNLAGYRILYSTVGPAGPSLDKSIVVNNPGTQRFIVEGLAAGPWAFAVQAFTSAGVYSVSSNTVTKAVP